MTRRATIRTSHDLPAVVAAAVAPDNTDEMSTRVEHSDFGDDDGDGVGDDDSAGGTDGVGRGTVVTTIERDSTGGLRTTVDDYVSNVTVAQDVLDAVGDPPSPDPTDGGDGR